MLSIVFVSLTSPPIRFVKELHIHQLQMRLSFRAFFIFQSKFEELQMFVQCGSRRCRQSEGQCETALKENSGV